MNQLFAVQVASRFVFVNLFPTASFAAAIGALILAGAPAHPPSWATLTQSVAYWGWPGAFAAVSAVAVFSIVIHPLSYPLIQLLEGYWDSSGLGQRAQAALAARYERWRNDLEEVKTGPSPPGIVRELAWIPLDAGVLPTRLGNVLRAGEMRAGQRYGLAADLGLLHVLLLASPAVKTEVIDTRNQLDTATRFCLLGLLAVPITLVLLWSHGMWLLTPLACYLFAWASYHSAIAAAKRFSEALAAAFDLYHLQLWDALSLQRPNNLEDEIDKGDALNKLLAGTEPIAVRAMGIFTWLRPTAAPERIYDISLNQQQARPPGTGGDANS